MRQDLQQRSPASSELTGDVAGHVTRVSHLTGLNDLILAGKRILSWFVVDW